MFFHLIHQHQHDKWRYAAMCKKICGLVNFVLFGVAIGAILGFIGIYLMEHDQYFRSKARKMCKKVDEFSDNIQSKFNNTNGN